MKNNGVATGWWKNFEDTFIRFDRMYERDRHTNTDGHTDGHRMTAKAALDLASSGKNHFKTTRRCSDRRPIPVRGIFPA